MPDLSASASATMQRLMAGPGCCSDDALLRAALEELSARDDELLPLPEVRRRLSISKSAVYDLMDRGLLPRPVKIGGAARWRSSDIAAVIAGTWRA